MRPERAADWEAIDRIHIEAFANHPYSRQTEHLIVNALRADGAMTVSLVAEVNGRVLGHIALSPARVGGREGGWFIAGPLGVLPAHQRRGIGRALLREGLEAISALGADGCVLVGDPAYYMPLGFGHNPALTMEGVPAANIMYLGFDGKVPSGEVAHHAAFLVEAR